MQLVQRGAAPVPVAVVDREDPQAGLEHERVRNHGIVRVGVLLDVEILLHGALGICEEWPLTTDRVSKLVDVELVVVVITTKRV